MSGAKYLKGPCQHCGGNIEFPVESTGTNADCPHCGQPTILMIAPPPMESSVPRRWLVMTVVAMVILLGGLAVCLGLLKRYEDRLARQKQRATAAGQAPAPATATGQPGTPAASSGLSASAVSLERTPGSSLVYAVGTLKNNANRQRFGVRIEFDLLDADGQKIGTAKDYQQVLEPGAEWRFKALVIAAKAVNARVASIQEDQ